MRSTRVSAKAVIIEDGMLLAIKGVDRQGVFYILPGGGQQPGEPLSTALSRECREEIGVEVEVGDILFVRDYIARNHEFALEDGDVHQVEIMFSCTIPAGSTPRSGTQPDEQQIGVEWLDLANFDSYRLYPRALMQYLRQHLRSSELKGAVYLGDVN